MPPTPPPTTPGSLPRNAPESPERSPSADGCGVAGALGRPHIRALDALAVELAGATPAAVRILITHGALVVV